jgi:hypothetical protein
LSGTPEVLIKDDNLISGNIKKNTIILGIPGKSTVADCSDCNVGSTGQVLAGVTAYGSDGNKFTGTMPNLGSEEYAGWRRADVFYPSDPGRVHLRIPLGAYLTGNAAQGGQLGVFCDDANFTPGNMLAGKTYFGLAGSAPIKYYATGTYAPGGTIISVDVGGLAFNLNDPFFVGIHTNLGYNYARVPNYGYGRIGSTTAYSFGVAGNYFTAGVQGCTSATWWVAAF